jgi:hypothetical protein
MTGELKGRTIAVLATDGVEQVELTEPVKALKDAGAQGKGRFRQETRNSGFQASRQGQKDSCR